MITAVLRTMYAGEADAASNALDGPALADAFHAILTHFAPEDSLDAERIRSAALAGIKMRAMEFEEFGEFPTTSIEELRAAAEAAGYEIEVLG